LIATLGPDFKRLAASICRLKQSLKHVQIFKASKLAKV